MSVTNFEFVSSSENQTQELAGRLAKHLVGGEIIQLVGDLGSGKTAFVKGLAAELGCLEDVTSPTFTVCNMYQGRLLVQHCDFYRMSGDALIEHELADMSGDDTVIVLEWAENLSVIDPEKTVLITIKPDAEDNRHFSFVIPSKYNYLQI